jgi:hypothetical protein
LHKWNFAAYDADPGWRHFLAMNKASAPYTNYGYVKPVLEESPKIKEAGWTAIDGYMLCNWNYLDRKNFSLKKFAQISALISGAEVSVPMKLLEMKTLFTDILLAPIMLVTLAAIVLMKGTGRVRAAIYLAGTVTAIGLLSVIMKVEPRVYFPMFCLVVLFALNECAEHFELRSAAGVSTPFLRQVLASGKSKLGITAFLMMFLFTGLSAGTRENRFPIAKPDRKKLAAASSS